MRYASAIARTISQEGAEPIVWWSPTWFPANQTLVESLEHLTTQVDGALIIATPDDETVHRGNRFLGPASNVLLEYGLFVGHLGRSSVAVVRVGDAGLPSDLDGVVFLSLPICQPDEDEVTYSALHVDRTISQWLRSLDVASTSGRRLSNAVKRLLPAGTSQERSRMKGRVLAEQMEPTRFVRQPDAELTRVLRRYASPTDEPEVVGFGRKTAVTSYLDLSKVESESSDERALVDHLCHHTARLIATGALQPTAIALSKVTRNNVTTKSAASMPYPLLMVNPQGPNPRTAVEGFYEDGDRAVLLHDVALSGDHLVQCVIALRNAGVQTDQIVTLVRYGADSLGLDDLMSANGIELHAATRFAEQDAVPVVNSRVLHASFSGVTGSPCVICDILRNDDTVPFRRLFSKGEAVQEPLQVTKSYSVIADIAPVAPGHLLIVSNSHVESMALLTRTQLLELETLRAETSEVLRRHYNLPVVAFEHGMCDSAGRSSCGVDHAHLHLVPLDYSVANVFTRRFDTVELESLSSVSDASLEGGEYLLFVEDNGSVLFSTATTPVAQYFRRIISEIRGEPLWNWMDVVLLRDDDYVKSSVMEVRALFDGG